MGGKSAVLLVLGFSLIFLVFGVNFGNLSNRSAENLSTYYIETKAHNIAVAGANMAANELFMDKNWETGYQNLPFDGGSITVYVSNTFEVTTNTKKNLNNPKKVIICHIPPGNPDKKHTICVGQAAVPAHLAHGCYVGTCDSTSFDQQMAVIISEGTFMGVTKVVYVELRPSYFSKFGNYYTSISAYPATGDTFSGPFHVNDRLRCYGSPVFLGKTTSQKKVTGGTPLFYGGYEWGIDIPLQFDTAGMRMNAGLNGKVLKDTLNSGKPIDVELYFDSTGSVTYRYSINNDGIWTSPQTVPLNTFTPNGIIYVEEGNVHTKGVLDGKVTVVASSMGNSNYGKIFIEDDLVYKTDPRVNPQSDDILGLVAERDIRIVANANTLGRDINTQASMFSKNGNIGPADGLVSQTFLGQWNILGGLIANTTRVTAQYSGGYPVRGLKFVHDYDERFLTYVPPFFPHTQNYEVVSWME